MLVERKLPCPNPKSSLTTHVRNPISEPEFKLPLPERKKPLERQWVRSFVFSGESDLDDDDHLVDLPEDIRWQREEFGKLCRSILPELFSEKENIDALCISVPNTSVSCLISSNIILVHASQKQSRTLHPRYPSSFS
mmetsp:Transcript_12783/g.23183  ORF Transcript_12783/g.23183 Transcript_12783/m.23183 type:complete len:137 (-) Transcript_12783:541-951(-)